VRDQFKCHPASTGGERPRVADIDVEPAGDIDSNDLATTQFYARDVCGSADDPPVRKQRRKQTVFDWVAVTNVSAGIIMFA
jgi:hypothetical protein